MSITSRTVVVALSLVLAGVLLAGATPAIADGTTSTTPSTTQATPAPAASAAAPSSSLPIESTIFAYQGLTYDAGLVANAITGKLGLNTPTQPEPSIIIGSPSDLAAFVQLRIVLQQAELLEDRLNQVDRYTHKPNTICPHPLPKITTQVQGQRAESFMQGFISTPSDLSTLVSTITSLSAVNNTLATSSGGLADPSLVDLVANLLPNAQIYTLSLYTPNVMAPPQGGDDPELNDTYVGTAVKRLNAVRYGLNQDAVQAGCKNAGLLSAIGLANASLDTFYWTLFTGQTPPAAPAAAAPAPAGKAPPPPPPPSVLTFPGLTPPAPTASSVMLQQILPVDLLLHQVFSVPARAKRSTPYFLVLHSLESGGQQLTKQNALSGSRIYVSGGAVSSFALFAANGSMLCSGIAYGYRGFVNVNDLSRAIGNDPDYTPTVRGAAQLGCRTITTPTPPAPVGPPPTH